jgi:hypothetical protein
MKTTISTCIMFAFLAACSKPGTDIGGFTVSDVSIEGKLDGQELDAGDNNTFETHKEPYFTLIQVSTDKSRKWGMVLIQITDQQWTPDQYMKENRVYIDNKPGTTQVLTGCLGYANSDSVYYDSEMELIVLSTQLDSDPESYRVEYRGFETETGDDVSLNFTISRSY